MRSRDTGPELALRRALHALGLRYRVAPKTVEGRPDLAFTRRRVAVFVDGDFWHGNAWRVRGRESDDAVMEAWRRRDFWKAKIERNVARDRAVDEALASQGWRVLRFWESELSGALDECVVSVVAAVDGA